MTIYSSPLTPGSTSLGEEQRQELSRMGRRALKKLEEKILFHDLTFNGASTPESLALVREQLDAHTDRANAKEEAENRITIIWLILFAAVTVTGTLVIALSRAFS